MDALELARLYVAALSAPGEETLADLAPALADDVRGAGAFGWGDGRDGVLATTASPRFPIMGMARWADPVVEGDRVTIRAEFPPGLPVVGATVTLRIAGGRICELVQELESAPPPEPSAVAIDDSVASIINGALDNRTPVIVAYVDAEGVPHQSPRGTVQVWSSDQLAMWIRDPNGGLLRAIATNSHVSCFYRDTKTRFAYELTGRARTLDDPNDRLRVFRQSPRVEQNLDPMMRGVAIVVDLDVVAGSGPGGRVNMQRESSARFATPRATPSAARKADRA
jgi:hypothetical protein